MRLFAPMTMLLAGALCAGASTPADSTLTALRADRQGLWIMAGDVFSNVALDQWRLPAGYTSVDGAYGREGNDHAWSGGASTYTRYRNSTLCGSARYSNGRRDNLPWCETSDAELLYPYLLADSTGGALQSETYSFSGSYAAHRGRWAWGASLAYRATLEYRSVDPRPRNVAGCLDASAALAFNIMADYMLGVQADFRRYTQSNDIEFKSEMGVEKIYHITGPESHYARFAGTGLSTHYQGYRYGAGLALYPTSGHGIFARAHISRFSFDNILSDLNKLPMARATHRVLELSAGYLHPGERLFWAVNASLSAFRRHGFENIFGDASSGVYPQIASLLMYARNATEASASVLVGSEFGRSRLWLRLDPAYSYSSTRYRNPHYLARERGFTPGAMLAFSQYAGRSWLLMAEASYRRTLYLDRDCAFSLCAARTISRRLALKAGGGASFRSDNNKYYNITIGLIF